MSFGNVKLEGLIKSGILQSYSIRYYDKHGNGIIIPGYSDDEIERVELVFSDGFILMIEASCSGFLDFNYFLGNN